MLTRARLLTILNHANTQEADFIFLQETRHNAPTLPWAARAAADLGWNIHLSEPPPYNARDTPKQGGTAVL